MATVAQDTGLKVERPDGLSGTPRAHAIDRWIFVGMAAWFIAIVLTGFIPDSVMKIAMVKAGQHPPFPIAMHVHAVLMGSFMLLLLAQTVMVATGRVERHKQVGMAAFALVPALVVAGLVLAPTTYHTLWQGAHFGPPPVQAALAPIVPAFENILLLQIRIGILFPLFLGLALAARARDSGFHKRMIFLGTAVTLPAAFDRMQWLPTTLPASPVAADLYVVLAILPMLAWDVMRNRGVHRAYWVWLPIYAAASLVVNMIWDTAGWHATAQAIMGV